MIIRKFFSFFILIFSIITYAQNSNPNAVDLFYSTKINTSINLDLIAVDLNFDDNITYTIVSNPSNGTASLSGNKVTYTPSTNYIGTDTFTYKANDGTADSDTKTVSIKVFKQYKTSFELLHTFKGEAAEDGYGRSVAMSDDNNTIAIGAFRNDGGGSNSGHVRVFRKSNGAWLQMGNDIDGESAGDYSGVSVDLSGDGSVLAVGAYLNDGNGANVGHVRIYKWNGSSWVQRGSDIDGGSSGDEQFGWTVALSADGNIFAAGAWKADYVGRTNNGIVRVYSWDGSSWSQIGSPLAETTSEDLYGTHLSFSRDGKKIAIGVPGLDNDNGDDAGGVQTREWVTSEGAYSFNGSRQVYGPAGSGLSSNSFSNDGKIVAVGGNNYDSEKGIARVYQRDADNQWVQLGSDLTGDSAGDHFALVSISGDGKILAVGGDLNDTGGTDAGHIKLYNYTNNQWSQIGSTISGDSSGDQLGFNPLVSRDGTLVIVPVINDDTTNGDDSGSVRLYNLIDSSNSKPVATAQTVTATEQTAKEITLAGTDADGETLTYSIVDSPSNGTVTLDGNTATYTSTSDTATSDSFTFKVNDGYEDSDAATVTINITAVNDKPVATAQTVTATEQTLKSIVLDGTDADGDDITRIVSSLPSNGTLHDDNGTLITSDDLPYTTAGTNVNYTSTSDSATSDSFTFKVNDGTVDSDAATVTINITGVNDAPSATAQTVTLEEQTAKTITLAGTDPDGDTLTYIVASLPLEGTLTDNGTAITSADLPKTTGTDVVYTSTSYTASSDSFTFKVNDGTVDSLEEGRVKQDLMNLQDLESYLRAKSPEELLIAYSDARPKKGGMTRAFNDGYVIRKEGIYETFVNNKLPRVPIMFGTTRYETKLFNMRNPDFVKWGEGEGFIARTLSQFGIDQLPLEILRPDYYNAINQYASDSWKERAVDSPSRDLINTGYKSTFAYRFDWDELPNVLGMDFAELIGSAHAMELLFLFPAGLENIIVKNLVIEDQESVTKLSDQMMSYWAEFAYSGSPGRGRSNELPEWNAWSDQGKYMILDSELDQGLIMSNDEITKSSIVSNLEKDTYGFSKMSLVGIKGEEGTLFTVIILQNNEYKLLEYGDHIETSNAVFVLYGTKNSTVSFINISDKKRYVLTIIGAEKSVTDE